MPTFNNEAVLRRAVESWRRFGGDRIELIVVEDGCKDGTAAYPRTGSRHAVGAYDTCDGCTRTTCTSCGARIEASRPRAGRCWRPGRTTCSCRSSWFVPELLATFSAYADLGLLCLSRGLNCAPCADPIERWEDLTDWRRLQSTIGPGAGQLGASPGSRCRASSVGRPARMPRSRGPARRGVPADGVGRSRPRVSHSRGGLESGDVRLRTSRRLPASRQHDDRHAVAGVSRSRPHQRPVVSRSAGTR